MSSVGQKRGRYTSAQKRAYWANSKFSGIHPWSSWGAARIERGSPWSLQNFGATARSADSAQKANRAMTGYTGRGLYQGSGLYQGMGKFRMKHAFKKHHVGRKLTHFAKRHHLGALAMDAGIAGIGALGGPEAAMLAEGARTAYTGKGSYVPMGSDLVANQLIEGGSSAMSTKQRAANPEVGGMVISHEEYIADIYGPNDNAFSNTARSINPGVASDFPWLAQLAMNFEEYKFRRLIFKYRPLVSDTVSNTNGQSGTVTLFVDYNPKNPPKATNSGMMNSMGAVSSKTTSSIDMGVECDPRSNAGTMMKFVRTGPVNDLPDFDYGTFQIGVDQCPVSYQNIAIGRLWVEYEVELLKPRLYQGIGGGVPNGQSLTLPSASGTTFNFMPGNIPTGIVGLDEALTAASLPNCGTADTLYRTNTNTWLANGSEVPLVVSAAYSNTSGSTAFWDTPSWDPTVSAVPALVCVQLPAQLTGFYTLKISLMQNIPATAGPFVGVGGGTGNIATVFSNNITLRDTTVDPRCDPSVSTVTYDGIGVYTFPSGSNLPATFEAQLNIQPARTFVDSSGNSVPQDSFVCITLAKMFYTRQMFVEITKSDPTGVVSQSNPTSVGTNESGQDLAFLGAAIPIIIA